MTISLNFELNDRDLEHFQAAMAMAKKAAEGKPAQEIIDCAAKLLADAQKVEIPDFILQRLLRLDDMIAMQRDDAWPLSGEDRDRVRAALTSFGDTNDVTPDHAPELSSLTTPPQT